MLVKLVSLCSINVRNYMNGKGCKKGKGTTFRNPHFTQRVLKVNLSFTYGQYTGSHLGSGGVVANASSSKL